MLSTLPISFSSQPQVSPENQENLECQDIESQTESQTESQSTQDKQFCILCLDEVDLNVHSQDFDTFVYGTQIPIKQCQCRYVAHEECFEQLYKQFEKCPICKVPFWRRTIVNLNQLVPLPLDETPAPITHVQHVTSIESGVASVVESDISGVNQESVSESEQDNVSDSHVVITPQQIITIGTYTNHPQQRLVEYQCYYYQTSFNPMRSYTPRRQNDEHTTQYAFFIATRHLSTCGCFRCRVCSSACCFRHPTVTMIQTWRAVPTYVFENMNLLNAFHIEYQNYQESRPAKTMNHLIYVLFCMIFILLLLVLY